MGGRKSAWRDAHPVTWWERAHPGEDTRELKRLKAWRAENPDSVDLAYAKSSHGRREGEGERTLTIAEWRRAVEFFGGCAYCGKDAKRLQKDHFIPVGDGGEWTAGNIVPACERCNKKKRNSLPEDFLKDRPEVLERIRSYLNNEPKWSPDTN